MREKRKSAVPMDRLIRLYIKEMKLTAGLNTHCIFKAWNDASGAEKHTTRRYFRDGTLYITLASSVIRNQLLFQRAALIEKMNSILRNDSLFDGEDSTVSYVKDLILK